MLDSLLTLTKGEAGWMIGFFVICAVADRLIAAMLGLPITLFALFAVGILAALVVTSLYTAGKAVFRRFIAHR